MEIPVWLNPFGLAYELGRRAGEKWANSPASEDPTMSTAAVIALGIARDVQEGRSLSKPYRLNPIKDAIRVGMVEMAVASLDEEIRGADLTDLADFFRSLETE